ncbi:biotin transporter BioY [Candidatus Latescibacterota bacterium]
MHRSTTALTRVALFAAVLAVSAYIRIPIGPVPLTLQSSAVLITGYCLGPLYGALATITYTAVGLAGLPVFASGGGPVYVLSPTFGYIIGFSFCAMVTGFLAQLNRNGSLTTAYIIMTGSLAALYIPGILWLIAAMHWIADVPAPVMTLLKAGLIAPLLGDILTTIPAAYIAIRLRKRLR